MLFRFTEIRRPVLFLEILHSLDILNTLDI